MSEGIDQQTMTILDTALHREPDWSNEVIGNGMVRIFGTWIKTIYGNVTGEITSSLLTDVLVYSNYVGMIIFTFLVMYVGWASVMKTAADGEIMGKNWSPVWLPMRTALAMTLLYPIAITGPNGEATDIRVSSVQKGVIYLAMIGSEMGDHAASQVYEALPAKSFSGDYSAVYFADGYPAQIFSSLTCHYIAEEFDETDSNNFIVRNMSTSVQGAYSVQSSSYPTMNAALGAALAKASSLSRSNELTDVELLFGGDAGACGRIRFHRLGSRPSVDEAWGLRGGANSTGEGFSEQITAYKGYWNYKSRMAINDQLAAILQSIDGLAQGAAKITSEELDYVRETMDFKRPLSSGMSVEQMANEFLVKRESLRNDFKSAIHDAGSGQDEDGLNLNAYFDYMNSKGWGGLGGVFFGIGQTSQTFTQGLRDAIPGRVEDSNPGSRSGSLLEHLKTIMKSLFSSDNDKMEFDTRINNTVPLIKKYIDDQKKLSNNVDAAGVASCDRNSSCATDEDGGKNTIAQIIKGSSVFNGMTAQGGADNESASLDGTAFPVAVMQDFGSTLVNVSTVAGLMQVTSMVAMKGLQAPDTSRAIPGAGIIANMLSAPIGVLVMMFMAIGMTTLALGVFLTYALPLMPTLIYIMMVIGYFTMVIEAFAASPLAIVQLATPEGEGISGTRMERAISILAALLLTPTLNVMGFVASITMLFVSFPIYNEFFWMAWRLIANNDVGNVLVEIIASVILYIVGATLLIRHCYMIMPSIKQHILEWFSSGASRAFGENEGASKMEGVGGSLSSGVNQTQSSLMSLGRQLKRPERKAKDDGDNGGGNPAPEDHPPSR